MIKTNISKRFTAVALSALTLAGGITAAASASTQAEASGIAKGKVISSTLAVRNAPTTRAVSGSAARSGDVLQLRCKVYSAVVGGNDIWYRLNTSSARWVSARYVKNIGAAPRECGTGLKWKGQLTKTSQLWSGPNLGDAYGGHLNKGSRFFVDCKVKAQSVGGNHLWYYTEEGGWLPARYVKNVGSAPALC